MLLNTCHNRRFAGVRQALTLIEMTVVIVVLMMLISMSMYAVNGYKEWQLGLESAQKIRMVYNAQRTYLAEHPTESVSSLTAAKIIPYLSDDSSALPQAEALDGGVLSAKITVSPPVWTDSAGSDYDPSGNTDDGQWDTGG